MKHDRLFAAATAVSFMAGTALAEGPVFVGLGVLDPKASPAGSLVTGISAGGEYIVGGSFVVGEEATQVHAFRWDEAGGMIDLGLSKGMGFQAALAGRVSADGSVVTGAAGFSIGTYIEMRNGMYWRFEDGQPVSHDLPEAWIVTDVADNGVTLVGGTRVPDSPWPMYDQAFVFTEAGGLRTLGLLPGGSYTWASAISGDGATVVGFGDTPEHGTALVWTEAGGLRELPGWDGAYGWASGVSANGSIIVGLRESRAFAWTAPAHYRDLGTIPQGGEPNPLDVSADGSLVVGYAWLGEGPIGMVWSKKTGRNLDAASFLSGAGLDVAGWTFTQVTGVSDNASRITGQGLNPDGREEAWLAILPPAAYCYGDFDSDGTLSLFDFLAYVNTFNSGDPSADCDLGGTLDLFDFLCFVNAFNGGC
jgi:probable HAF family extracellular repeat protein